jgi:predicted proteasome-type protease
MVGPPVDLVMYPAGDLRIRHQCRLAENDPQLMTIHSMWEQALRQAVKSLPSVRFCDPENPT